MRVLLDYHCGELLIRPITMHSYSVLSKESRRDDDTTKLGRVLYARGASQKETSISV